MTTATHKMKSRSINSDDYNQEKLQILSESLISVKEDLLDTLGVETVKAGQLRYGPCPIHGGDRFNAFNIYNSGYWCCRTHNCETIFKKSIIGMVRGILSHQRYGWESEGDTIATFAETIEFISAYLKTDFNSMKIDEGELEKKLFARQIQVWEKPAKPGYTITREMIRNSLIIPAQYYIDRKYSKEILDTYDVGLCMSKDKPMYNRVVVPIYDEEMNFVGCTGRTIHPYCPKCKLYHMVDRIGCPEPHYAAYFSKWKHSYGFNAENHLYNLWRAAPVIKETGIVILVESPGNVWRLEENGIHNSVGLFGAKLTDGQKGLLDRTGAMTIIVLGDNDAAGKSMCDDVLKKCQRTYRLYFPDVTDKEDIGEMNKDEITADIKPILEKIKQKTKKL